MVYMDNEYGRPGRNGSSRKGSLVLGFHCDNVSTCYTSPTYASQPQRQRITNLKRPNQSHLTDITNLLHQHLISAHHPKTTRPEHPALPPAARHRQTPTKFNNPHPWITSMRFMHRAAIRSSLKEQVPEDRKVHQKHHHHVALPTSRTILNLCRLATLANRPIPSP